MDNEPTTPPADETELPESLRLDKIEARILGSLIEKQATTPDVYPLTLNATVVACNQKSNRDPTMDLEPGAVGNALRRLENRDLVVGALSARSTRYEHRFDKIYGVTARQRAVLCVLMLRGPQTFNEIMTRTDRLAQFPSADDLQDTLDRLIQRSPALVVRMGASAGQREDRYMHLMSGPVSAEQFAAAARAAPSGDGGTRLADRVERLEAQVEALQRDLRELASRLPPES